MGSVEGPWQTEAAATAPEEIMTEADSAMASGSDDGTPGRHPAAEPLSPEEQAMLADLTAPAPHVVDPVEDSVAASYAVADDAPLPPGRRPERERGADPDTPQFREP
jgi:hypothetical protein